MRIFSALGDETRRSILELLAGGEMTSGEIAAQFPYLTRQAVSNHLQILAETGLLQVRKESQRRVYVFDPGPLAEIEVWIETQRRAPGKKRRRLRKLRGRRRG